MPVLVTGRLVQGLGGGALTVSLYVVVARVYPAVLHPGIFAAFSAAWVVPSLVGPFAAGIVAEVLSWHWVFLGVVGLVVPALVMIVPVLRGMDPPAVQATPPPWAVGRIAWAALAALAVLGLNLSADVTIAGVPAAPALLAAAAVVIALVAVRPLVPRGTLLARRGLPSVILTRGLAGAAFFGAEVYLPYLLIEQYAFPPTFAGLALTIGAVAWAGAAAIQGRLGTRLPHRTAVRIGAALVLVAIVLTLATAALHWPAAVAIIGWTFAGAGMGLLYPRLSVMTLALSTQGERGLQQFGDVHCGLAGRRAGPRHHGHRVHGIYDDGGIVRRGLRPGGGGGRRRGCRGAAGLRTPPGPFQSAVAGLEGEIRISGSGKPGGPEHGVADDGFLPVRAVDDPIPRGVDLHLPLGGVDAEFLHKLRGRVEHLVRGVGSPRRQPVRMVPDDQQRAARLNRGRRRPQRALPDQLRSVQELGGHQIVGLRGLPLVQVTLFPVDAAGDGARALGVHAFAVQRGLFVCGCPFQRDGGNVDGGDGPALLGEPDGVGAFAAAQVQCLARPQPAAFADQLGVGFAAPDLRLAAVSFVPGLSGTLLPLLSVRGASPSCVVWWWLSPCCVMPQACPGPAPKATVRPASRPTG